MVVVDLVVQENNMSRTFRRVTYEYSMSPDLDTHRDKKKWYKSDSMFKKIKKKKFRATIKDFLNKQRELPLLKKTNDYEYN